MWFDKVTSDLKTRKDYSCKKLVEIWILPPIFLKYYAAEKNQTTSQKCIMIDKIAIRLYFDLDK